MSSQSSRVKDPSPAAAPLFTRHALIVLLLPLIAEQALNVTIGLADTLMVSSIGEAAVSGVSLVDSFNTLMIQILSALATGGAVVTSQYIGRREGKNAQAAAAQILFIMLAFSCTIALIVAGGRTFLLRAIFGSIDADVMNYARTYFLLSALSYPFMGMYSAGAALFRAQGNSKISMFSSLVMNIVNIGGNAILIFGFGMGVMGAALASLVSRAIACFAVLFLLQHPDSTLRLEHLADLKPNGALIRRILDVGIPNSVENSMFQIGKLAVSSLVSTMGTSAIAANAVASTLTTFLNIPANAVGMATLTVVGQCIGAGEKKQARHYSSRLLLVAYVGAWVMNLSALLFLNRAAVSLYHLSAESQAIALEVMVWFNIISLFVWPSSFTLPNILRAAGDSRYTMQASILSMWLFRVGFCYVAVKCFNGHLLSIWMGMFLDWGFRSLLFGLRYFSGKWMDKKVI
jgi:putative MATE family efflux protein